MKTALILHGTDATPQSNWFPWLSSKLKEDDYLVWVATLPKADKPNMKLYTQVLLSTDYDLGNCPVGWKYDENTLIIGHSSGAVAILGLLQALPASVSVDKCILVSAFKNDLGWNSLSELFEEKFDFDVIKSKAKKIIFVHSDNDPYVPIEQPKYLAEKLGAELIILPQQGHFSASTDPRFKEFPEILDIINRQ